MNATEAQAYEALKLARRMIKEALPKFNWGASALDANAIQLLNETPRVIRAAILALENKPAGEWQIVGGRRGGGKRVAQEQAEKGRR